MLRCTQAEHCNIHDSNARQSHKLQAFNKECSLMSRRKWLGLLSAVLAAERHILKSSHAHAGRMAHITAGSIEACYEQAGAALCHAKPLQALSNLRSRYSQYQRARA